MSEVKFNLLSVRPATQSSLDLWGHWVQIRSDKSCSAALQLNDLLRTDLHNKTITVGWLSTWSSSSHLPPCSHLIWCINLPTAHPDTAVRPPPKNKSVTVNSLDFTDFINNNVNKNEKHLHSVPLTAGLYGDLFSLGLKRLHYAYIRYL